MDYQTYHFTIADIGEIMAKTMGIVVILGMLFYRSLWAGIGLPLIFWMMLGRARRQKIKARLNAVEEEFLSGIKVFNTSLQAGLSMENAWREVEREVKMLYGTDSCFYQEVKEITNQISMNVPIEKLLLDFGYRTGIEDIMSFSEVLDYGKKSGGNWKKIIDTTVLRICEKEEAQKEIQVLIAEKRLEQQIMNLLPLGILAFLQLSAWDYMKILYGNPLGVLCMSLCLLAYVGAIFLSEKLMDIEV